MPQNFTIEKEMQFQVWNSLSFKHVSEWNDYLCAILHIWVFSTKKGLTCLIKSAG